MTVREARLRNRNLRECILSEAGALAEILGKIIRYIELKYSRDLRNYFYLVIQLQINNN